jgi:uncharacterized repeat protein (TIGR03803 family)
MRGSVITQALRINIGISGRSMILAAALLLLTVIAAPAQTFQVLHNFTGGNDGGDAMAGLTMDQAGNLYGTTWSGGSVGVGSVFELQHKGSGWVLKTLYSFRGGGGAGGDGAGPIARVIFGPDGALYGTTAAGTGASCYYYGYSGCGTVFRLQPPATVCKEVSCPWTETILYRAGDDDGQILAGEVAFDQAGNLYSTVEDGGEFFNGYVFELSPSANGHWTSTVLHSFNEEQFDGTFPRAGLVIDQAGNLYGTTTEGGQYADGTAFELSPSGSGWNETILHSFSSSADGNSPMASLVFGRQGNLYGTVFNGGPNGGGTVFELSPAGGGWTFSLPWSFSGTGNGGEELAAAVTLDGSGNLYGTTFAGGCCGAGTIFELSPGSGGWSETVLHNFTEGNDGGAPVSSVVLDSQGNGYGTASLGGANGKGVIWEVTP